MISAYAIGKQVWLIHTDKVAEPIPPTTLPIGSLILTPADATALIDQLSEAFRTAARRAA